MSRWVGCRTLAPKSPRAQTVIGRLCLMKEINLRWRECKKWKIPSRLQIAGPRPNAKFGIACRGALATGSPHWTRPLCACCDPCAWALSLAAAADLTTLVPHPDPTLSLCNLLCPPLPSLFVQSLLCHLFLLILQVRVYRQLGTYPPTLLAPTRCALTLGGLRRSATFGIQHPHPHRHPPWPDDST